MLAPSLPGKERELFHLRVLVEKPGYKSSEKISWHANIKSLKRQIVRLWKYQNCTQQAYMALYSKILLPYTEWVMDERGPGTNRKDVFCFKSWMVELYSKFSCHLCTG